jgi:hypothetical protein
MEELSRRVLMIRGGGLALSIQQAQLQQRANTLYVVVPKRDTLTVRVASGTVQVGDTLHAVVRQTGGGAYALTNVLLATALIGVTVWAHRRTHAVERRNSELEQKNVELQERNVELQRQFNETQVAHEKERRADEARRNEEHQRAVDAQIGAEAYVVRRMIRAWIIPMQHARALGAPPTVELLGIGARDEAAAVEERLHRMVVAAPLASPAVGKAAREAYVLYYKARGPGPKPPESLADLQHKPVHVRRAQEELIFTNLEACLGRLTAAIDPELRDH